MRLEEFLVAMLLKALDRAGADNTPALAELLCLPGNVVMNLVKEAVEGKLLKVTGSNRGGAISRLPAISRASSSTTWLTPAILPSGGRR